ncbi:hypothetical protein DCS_07871 [Drechmeria coniospora]|uniref:Uncharacterized protein n=1 Tax=Drechmeria coniospora TaxID=98403 RepID=A0A151GFR3_DRECN|nr:hypothetical protein DCS_07871 [Drechmeria coniospora]KYK55906.1 hypothetical protein DCS_07871 [Drechmeria coniospora]
MKVLRTQKPSTASLQPGQPLIMASYGQNLDCSIVTVGDANEDLSSQPQTMSKRRDPPPVLFLHPSPGASHVSLPSILARGVSVPGPSSTRREQANLERSASVRSGLAVPCDTQRSGRPPHDASSTRHPDRADALWTEMQATLEEVELSASGGTHVFGPEHDIKLADLRTAQIALAQAWARSEADDAIETSVEGGNVLTAGGKLRNLHGLVADAQGTHSRSRADTARSTVGTINLRPESSDGGADLLGMKLGEEPAVDILLARKRREANDQYFQRVSNGVIDVVAKLEEVAIAMRAVEMESKYVWNEN